MNKDRKIEAILDKLEKEVTTDKDKAIISLCKTYTPYVKHAVDDIDQFYYTLKGAFNINNKNLKDKSQLTKELWDALQKTEQILSVLRNTVNSIASKQ